MLNQGMFQSKFYGKFFAGDKMIKGVIFDIDGTIYSYIENHKRALKTLCEFTEKNLGVSEE